MPKPKGKNIITTGSNEITEEEKEARRKRSEDNKSWIAQNSALHGLMEQWVTITENELYLMHLGANRAGLYDYHNRVSLHDINLPEKVIYYLEDMPERRETERQRRVAHIKEYPVSRFRGMDLRKMAGNLVSETNREERK